MLELTSRIGVVGAGTMGTGIAQVVAQSGYAVTMIDTSNEFLQRGMERIQTDLSRSVARRQITSEDQQSALGRITTGTDYALLSDCQVVIEAVPESLAIKEAVLTSVSAAVGADCIIASNTSSLCIDDLSTFVTHRERMVGMHFFNPVTRMALVEVVAGIHTEEKVVTLISQLAESLGKTPIRSADTPGFIVNRVLIPMINEAVQTLQEGVGSAEDIDTAMKLGAGFPMGPLALADLIGLDVVLDILEVLQENLGDKYTPATLLVDMAERGALGRKNGHGFFVYEGNK